MTKDEALELALEALEHIESEDNDRDFLFPYQCTKLDNAITAIKQALLTATPLAAPVQQSRSDVEPVAWMHWLNGPCQLFMDKDEAMMELDRLNREYPVDGHARKMRPLVFGDTAPPAAPRQSAQRQWVGLTGQQKNLIARISVDVFDAIHRAEAKLRSKNT